MPPVDGISGENDFIQAFFNLSRLGPPAYRDLRSLGKNGNVPEKERCHPCEEYTDMSHGFRDMMLFGIGDGTGLADDRDLDLSRIRHFILDLLGDVG